MQPQTTKNELVSYIPPRPQKRVSALHFCLSRVHALLCLPVMTRPELIRYTATFFFLFFCEICWFFPSDTNII